MLIIGIVKESKEKENRVAVTPDVVQRIKKLGYQVQIETNAGIASNFLDTDYVESGAEVLKSAKV